MRSRGLTPLFLVSTTVVGVLAAAPTADAKPAPRKAGIEIRYDPPKNPEHQGIYDTLRKAKALERIRDRLAGISLPRTLLLKTEGCDGDINAAYDPGESAIGICYEYLAYIQELAGKIPPDIAAKESLTPANYVVGPFLEVTLHELAHAIFDLRKVPVLGREEDAADQVATYVLLQFGNDEVRRVISSIAVMYASEAREAAPKLKDFANEHGLPAQRFFNLICITYGSDPKFFGDAVSRGYLPADRAEQCPGEFAQVKYAFDTLIWPVLGARKPPPANLPRKP
ncbi:DUF4344 domain-containing metallopeptidase [Alsobacter sp. KACC 23698]|uniref:DUF4344 domain-containing metallopeptidase n=1 Tax=Alsobacter sp. KACC 23698 TaxID=3149229 RepID=A0AAU7JAP9_9HYPH